jgi:hypothetical protein
MDSDLLELYKKGIKTKEDIEVDYKSRLEEKERVERMILLKTGLLCLRLTEDYFRETRYILSKMEAEGGETLEIKYKRRELDNNIDIGSFVIDDDNRKYYRILQLTDTDVPKTHCFVDMKTGIVYKPRNSTTANKKLAWDIDECIRVADWRGYYLNEDPKIGE